MNSSERRHELDWLRVIAILLVFVFHSGRFFDPTDWHVKSPVTYPQLEMVAVFVVSWMIPLVFAVSGASVFYAAGKGGSGKFLQSKVLRLLVPLAVGIFTHIPLQVYLERRTHHQFYGSFWEFLPHYFDGIYETGNGNFPIGGMHLWYLLVLFIFTVLFAPVFRWLRRGSGQAALRYLGRTLAAPGAVYLLTVPVILLLNLIDPRKGIGKINVGGWSVLIYLPFYLAGFVLYSHEGLAERVRQSRWLSLGSGMLGFALLLQQFAVDGIPLWGTDRYQVLSIVYGFCAWFWVLAFFGFAQNHLTFPTAFLKYANEAVLPFYILHQSVLLVVGYYVIPWSMSSAVTYLVIASSSLAIILLLYELVIRRSNLFRFLFGMKPLPHTVVVARGEPASIGD